ncbi:MAG: ABC transporter ATP-binding protein [Clostridia bacterium]|nr:ABC transporter ATP-binding protein [Clostridia bacterium]
MSEITVSAENLTIGYTSPIVRGIDFTVRGGEIMTLIAPNGAGKSTLLKTLSGTIPKLGGTIKLLGKNDDTVSAKERARFISALLTENANAPLMTAREVVEMGRYPYTGYFGKFSENDTAAVCEAIRLTQIEEFADKEFAALSDGQRQRVLLARAICQEPQIMFLDEPTSYLDIHHKIAFLEILKKLAKEKQIAVVMSLHELDFAREISDFIICLRDGAVFRQGNAAEIFGGDTVTRLFDISEEMFKRYINS